MSKHIELARKLKALSEQGIGGEKTTAEEMLNALLKKHNITIEEIEGEKLEDYYFNIKDEQHNLWIQVVKRVNISIKIYGAFPKKLIKELRLEGNYMIKCTASEYIEIEAKFDFYNKLFKAEFDIFVIAFFNANDLLIDNPNQNKAERTDEDYEKWARIHDMSKKITTGQFMKQLSK
jgi:hypothetical protein